ncbi:Short-chain dehydrogenase/reductase SAT3 [Lachnellula suecica]|uniref:Short-chain dehydrogenase/reductase SAT3 n=1 Tax=Lachnellula suecica TaxID=602035 RepID=A0A8T9CHB2_9HELO|nr:Short-chain dehydrogenase/reductase SAT3 [Lachnellula suecica]
MATTSIQASNLFNVNGLVAVITGGGSGIGLMMARALALNGAHKVYIIGRRKEVLEKASKSVSTNNIIPLTGDVTSKEALASIVSTIQSEEGYINLLIANSGILGPQSALPPAEIKTVADFQKAYGETPFEEFADTFKLNTAAVWYTILAFLGLLDEGNKKGNVEQKSQVIATSSIGGFNRAVPGGYAYGESKAATTHMMKQLATGLAPLGIRSNIMAPGLFPSELAAGIIGDGVFPRDKIPLERVGTEEDMAGAILFLASRAGAYCTEVTRNLNKTTKRKDCNTMLLSTAMKSKQRKCKSPKGPTKGVYIFCMYFVARKTRLPQVEGPLDSSLQTSYRSDEGKSLGGLAGVIEA